MISENKVQIVPISEAFSVQTNALSGMRLILTTLGEKIRVYLLKSQDGIYGVELTRVLLARQFLQPLVCLAIAKMLHGWPSTMLV